MVYIKKSVLVKSIIIDDVLETISFIFQLPNKFQIYVIACYRTESKLYSDAYFFTHLNSKLLKLDKICDDIFITGDLNNDMTSTVDNSLQNFCTINGFSNTITKGTRINLTIKLFTLLDVILCICVINSSSKVKYSTCHVVIIL